MQEIVVLTNKIILGELEFPTLFFAFCLFVEKLCNF